MITSRSKICPAIVIEPNVVWSMLGFITHLTRVRLGSHLLRRCRSASGSYTPRIDVQLCRGQEGLQAGDVGAYGRTLYHVGRLPQGERTAPSAGRSRSAWP